MEYSVPANAVNPLTVTSTVALAPGSTCELDIEIVNWALTKFKHKNMPDNNVIKIFLMSGIFKMIKFERKITY